MIESTLVTLHLAIAVGLMAVLALILVIAVPAALRGQAPPALYRPLHRAAAALVGVQVLLGLLLLATGKRPHENIHFVYAIAALLIMPVARSMARSDPGKARWYNVGGTLLFLGVVFRLLTTG